MSSTPSMRSKKGLGNGFAYEFVAQVKFTKMYLEESTILAFVFIFHLTAERGSYTHRIASEKHACYFFLHVLNSL